jgi:pyrroloquinoline quinone biosynthesis protein B
VEAVPVPGKRRVHLEGLAAPGPGDNVGLRIREAASGRVLAYLTGVAAVDAAVERALDGAHCVFFDGTFWASDELPALGLGDKRAEAMAHLPVGGPEGSLARLQELRAPRRLYIHVNNTNPMLREDGPERAAVMAAGWEVAEDGMEIRL